MFPLLPALASVATTLLAGGSTVKAPAVPKPKVSAPKTIAAPKATPIAPLASGGYSGGSSYYVPPPVYAPKLDFGAIQAQARSSVEGGVNAYYTDQLNKFLNRQAVARRQTQEQTQSNIQDLEENLKNTLGENQLKQTRTGEDVATNVANIANTADEFQTDSGSQAEAERLALAKNVSTGGLGAQQLETQQQANATTEGRQVKDFEKKTDEQQIYKARTFEDLARSGELATSGKEKGVKKANVELANFIENQGLDLTQQQDVFAKQREADILTQAQQKQGTLVQQWINSIANPAQRNAALQAYGGLMG